MAVPPPLLLLSWALAALLAPSTARPAAANASAAPGVVEVRVGVLLPGRNLRYPWAWPRVGPALSLALEALGPQLLSSGLAVRTAFASTEREDGACNDEVALFQATGLMRSHDPDVLLGLGCVDTSSAVAPLAQYLQLPLLRAGDCRSRTSRAFRNTTVYAGPARPPPNRRPFEAQLLQHFSWTCPPVLVIGPKSDWGDCSVLWSSWLDSGTFVYHYKGPGEAVRFIRANGRVVFIYGPLEMLQEIMRLAQAQNMTNGDYVFIYVDFFGESLRAEGHCEAAKPWQSKESRDAGGLREAFQTVLVVTSYELQTPEYRRFQSQLILRAQRDFGVAVNDSVGTLVAGCFHDVLLLYLRALSETLREGGTKRNTSRILEEMRGLKIQGVTGTMSIDSSNSRETNFDLWAMKDVESGEYQVVARYMESKNWINWTGPIHWKKGGPPLDNPPCAFQRNNSSSDKRAVGSTSQRQEAEDCGFVTTWRETAVCSGAFCMEDRDLSPEGEEGRAPLTWKKPKMVSALLQRI